MSTVFISNLTSFSMLDKIPNSIGVAWGVTYGFGANAISASVSSGISNLAIQKETKIREQNVGQGRHFDGRTGKSFKFNVYKTSSGSLKKRPHKTYIPSNAYTV